MLWYVAGEPSAEWVHPPAQVLSGATYLMEDLNQWRRDFDSPSFIWTSY